MKKNPVWHYPTADDDEGTIAREVHDASASRGVRCYSRPSAAFRESREGRLSPMSDQEMDAMDEFKEGKCRCFQCGEVATAWFRNLRACAKHESVLQRCANKMTSQNDEDTK